MLDDTLLRLWQWADGRTESELRSIALFRNEATLREQLLALRTAGLLTPESGVPAFPNSSALAEPLPLVSVIIVTHNGWHHLRECLPSLSAQTYPHIEILVVDDRSDDGTQSQLVAQFPAVRIIVQTNGPNFAAGCNLGIQHARGELMFLLNNDTVLDPNCVRELVATYFKHENVAGVAALMRFYDNRPFINGLGTYIPHTGHGHDVAIGSLDVGQFDHVTETPLLCFGAALLVRRAIEQVGLLDEAFQFYYEDADWSYRARRRGLSLLAAPRALVYHKFGASTGALPSAFKTRLVTRNRLRYVWRNLPWREALSQSMSQAKLDVLRFVKHLFSREVGFAFALLRGWLDFEWRSLAILADRYRHLGSGSAAPVDLRSLAAPFPPPELQGVYPRLTRAQVEHRYVRYLALSQGTGTHQRVLIISPDTVNVNMGGVGVRYWELAQVLAREFRVTLAVPGGSQLSTEAFELCSYTQGNAESLSGLVEACDTVILSGFTIYHHPFLRQVTKTFIVDLYDPTMFENLHLFANLAPSEQESLNQAHISTYQELLQRGDFFICASEKQRDFWLGALTILNRVRPTTYAFDPTLRHLIDVVPLGIPDTPPQITRRVLKGVYPGIAESDKVILWGGGLWDWLDPLTAIEAMPQVLGRVPEAKLFFMGTRHPNAAVPASRMAERAIERATALGLKDRTVFFHDWVPYALRSNYLLEADVGISLHTDHIETRFAVRTRLMDYLWASLPMVVSSGDTLSELVQEHGLGRVVQSQSADSVAESIIEMLCNRPDAGRFHAVQELFRWTTVAQPLMRYLAIPHNKERAMQTAQSAEIRIPSTPLRRLPFKAAATLHRHGMRALMQDIRSYVAWRLR